MLRDAGLPVRLGLLDARARLKGDAAIAAERWTGAVENAVDMDLTGSTLLVDALFGAGLSRDLSGDALALINAVARADARIVAVDVPSGLDGDTGAIRGGVLPADLTVTFFRRKPGHLLLPGRRLCGEVRCLQIGIPVEVLGDIRPQTMVNDPGHWRDHLPSADLDDHKYRRGHGVIAGGARMTGAAQLAARAAWRAGIGLLTIASPCTALDIYHTGDPGLLVQEANSARVFDLLLADPRRNAVLIGPGLGVSPMTRALAKASLGTARPVVLDADAISAFEGQPEDLVREIAGPVVMTPHEGEFRRVFGKDDAGGVDKLERVRAAARLSGATIVLKGADTVIAAPDGRAWINENAPSSLATGGTGDVLAGIVLALLTQGMPTPEAAAAAVWIHGAAAQFVGPGLVAEDLADHVCADAPSIEDR